MSIIPQIFSYTVLPFCIYIHIYSFSVIDFVMDLLFSTGDCLHLRNVTCQVYQFLQ